MRALLLLLLSLCSALTLRPLGYAADVTLITVNGEEISGTFQGADLGAGFNVGGKTVKLEETAEIRLAGTAGTEETSGLAQIRLLTGAALRGKIIAGTDKALKISSSLLGEVEIKNGAVQGLSWPRPELAERKIADYFAAPGRDKDTLLTIKGEVLSGFLVSLGEKSLEFDDGQKRTIPYEQLAAIRYAELEKVPALPGVQAALKMKDGSELSGVLAGADADKLSLKLYEGLALEVPLHGLRAVTLKGGKMLYLSDWPGLQAEEAPLIGGYPVVFHWRKDRSAAGGALKMQGKEYPRGLGVHPRAKFTLNLEGGYERLLADVGLDDVALAGAVCIWKISGDGKPLASGEARAGAAALSLKLDVKGVRKLELLCDFGPDHDDTGCHLDWGNARLVKN